LALFLQILDARLAHRQIGLEDRALLVGVVEAGGLRGQLVLARGQLRAEIAARRAQELERVVLRLALVSQLASPGESDLAALADRYQILDRLSAGAMGVVYRAERKGLGRIVAVKFLHSAFAFSTDFTKRFELEARTMSRLDHPNCVSVIDFGVADAPFIVMDF